MNLQQAILTWGSKVTTSHDRNSAVSWSNVLVTETFILKKKVKSDPLDKTSRRMLRRYVLSTPALLQIQHDLVGLGITRFSARHNSFQAEFRTEEVALRKLGILSRKFKMRPVFTPAGAVERRMVKCRNLQFGIFALLKKLKGKGDTYQLTFSMENL